MHYTQCRVFFFVITIVITKYRNYGKQNRTEQQWTALFDASRDSKIVAIGDKLSNLRTIISDYRQLGDALWQRFSAPNGKEDVLWYYTLLASALKELADTQPYKEYLALLEKLKATD